MNEAINNGKLKERLLYWADHFEADWADDLAPAAGPANNAMTQLNSGLHGKVGSIEKWCGAASRRTIVASARRRGDAPPAQASHRYHCSGRRVPPLLRVLYHSRRNLWDPVR